MKSNSDNHRQIIIDMCMEAYLEPCIPTYSGGLGVLEGDILKSYADLRIPAVGIIQSSTAGYFGQAIDGSGWQREAPVYWDPKSTLGAIDEKVVIKNRGRNLYVGASPYVITGETGFKINTFLLDTDLEENHEDDREITGRLYDGNPEQRIAQENVLGQAGVKLVRKLYGDKIIFHANEGHAAFASLELLREGKSIEDIKRAFAFTTHTPVAAGHDRWNYDQVANILGDFLPENIREFAGQNELNMTQLALSFSSYVNAVSRKHAEVCREMDVFKGRKIDYITNGVHPKTWASESFRELFHNHFPHWTLEPRVLSDAKHIFPEEILEAKNQAKRHLIGYINTSYPVKFRQDALTLVWARRFTSYKRPDLLIRDIDRLYKISEKCPLQIIYSGKAHPSDEEGKKLIQKVVNFSRDNNKSNLKAVFLEDYNAYMAKLLMGGADVWVNTPRRPQEASGTSGMKAALNGCLNLSTYDGWVAEGYEMAPDAIWLVGPEKEQTIINPDWQQEDAVDSKILYENLEQIAGLYPDKEEWAKRMGSSIGLLAYFNTHRVVKELASKLGIGI